MSSNVPNVHFNEKALRVMPTNLEADVSGLDPDIASLVSEVGKLLLSPFQGKNNIKVLRRRIKQKEEFVLRRILEEIDKSIREKDISPDSQKIADQVGNQAEKVFNKAIEEFFSGTSGSSAASSVRLTKAQLAVMLHRSGVYEEKKDEFVDEFRKAILLCVQKSSVYDRSVRDKVTDLIAKVVNDLYNRLRGGRDATVEDVV